jgi:hypothetical protein
MDKPILVATRPPLPPEVDERVTRDFVARFAESADSLTQDGLLARPALVSA